nr:MAG TPA: Platelet-derived growth factor subunit A-knot, growth factor, Hormone.4A [Caudoviricetes sp.]
MSSSSPAGGRGWGFPGCAPPVACGGCCFWSVMCCGGKVE